jgi:hypothetical protein
LRGSTLAGLLDKIHKGEPQMKQQQIVKTMAACFVTLGAIVLVGTLRTSPPVHAQNQWDDEATLVRIGYQIAPVPLNLAGKDPNLVGLGSFLVNAVGDCNGCHTAGGPPNFNYANGGNPYFGQPKVTDPTTYLAGGTDFGPAVPPSAAVGGFPPGSQPPSYPPAAYGTYVGPDIISRNLTPDKTGRAEGGRTLQQFIAILRTGIDLDNLHPTCTSASPVPTPANCIPPPVDGNLLQVMPWPTFQSMTDHQLTAIYEYLSSIPCIEGPTDPNNVLHNDCGSEQKPPKPGNWTKW